MLVEKYRPKTLDEVIGQEEVVKAIKNLIGRGNLPHLLFVGPAGTGKTTVAMCIAREIYGDEWQAHFVELNASDERGIDVVRNKIKRLAQSKGERIIFLDEADALTEDAQHALRRIMEKSHATFILSCNYEHKLIAPIKSRCARFVFKPIDQKLILRRILEIIKTEGIKFEATEETKKALTMIAEYANGDLRYAINLLEKIISKHKEITKESVMYELDINLIRNSIEKALEGNFVEARKMLEDSYIVSGGNFTQIVNEIYKYLDTLNNEVIKVKLYEKLAEVEYRCTVGASPLIQLVGFLAYCWVIQHVPER